MTVIKQLKCESPYPCRSGKGIAWNVNMQAASEKAIPI